MEACSSRKNVIMKQILLNYFVFPLLLLCSGIANAQDFEVDGIYYNITSDNTVDVACKVSSLGSDNSMYVGSLVIPEQIYYLGVAYKVTGVHSGTFDYCQGITNITLPNSIIKIGEIAFRCCKNLVSITIPNSVKIVEGRAFSGCTNLRTAVIGNSLTNIDYSMFSGCSSLESVKIGDGVTHIGSAAFRDCSSLKKISIPNSVTTIEDNAFWGCSSLSDVTIGSEVAKIGNQAFYNCKSLTKVVIPQKVKYIGDYAFSGCKNIKNIVIKDAIDTLRLVNLIDKDCILDTLYLGRNINNSPFSSIKTLKHITLSKYVTGINNYSFQSCSSLESVKIGDGVTHIGSAAFRDCSSLKKISIPNSVTTIEDNAFWGCSSLSDVTIGSEVAKIGRNAFHGCKNISSLYINSLSNWCKIIFYDSESNPIKYAKHIYIKNVLTTKIVIPNSVTRIESYSFIGWQGLKKITIPNNVTNIGYSAFKDCYNVTSIISFIEKNNLFSPESRAFSGIDKGKCILYIPKDAKEIYSVTDGWKDFKNIVEIKNTYIATFVIDDKEFATDSIAEGDKVIYPEIPEKEGYSFKWDKIIETMPSNDITITGIYTVNKYQLTYKVDGEVYATDSIAYGAAIEPAAEPTKEGHTFSGWSDIPATMPAEDIIIEGSFSVNSYTVTFMIDDEVYETAIVEFGAEIEFPTPAEKPGYIFSGWSDIPATMPAEDIVIEGSYIVDTTGIGVIGLDFQKNEVYNLKGQRVTETENLVRGIYIVNGKRVFIK